jgi:hypothetical protein
MFVCLEPNHRLIGFQTNSSLRGVYPNTIK